ncbi:MAG: hypothetical protein JOZ90_07125 [Alphaproteobacteria bacterium]|nr:hypothetical protein [Alphaproteobacteria bacterium]MBV9371659.1 hypothetical protein [Alphaproteobacteria bacterium]MBV9900855.1 hypothetical protein [Alphaproteobacteria bacterium]
MKLRRETRDTLLAWSGIMAGAFAWFGSQQFGSNLVFAGCSPGDNLMNVVVGLLALALTAAGAFFSWRIRAPGDSELSHPFIGFVSLLVAGLLAVAIVLQIVAALLIPACFG